MFTYITYFYGQIVNYCGRNVLRYYILREIVNIVLVLLKCSVMDFEEYTIVQFFNPFNINKVFFQILLIKSNRQTL